MPRITMKEIASTRTGAMPLPGAERNSATTSPSTSASTALINASYTVSQNASRTKEKLSRMMSRSKYCSKKTSIGSSQCGPRAPLPRRAAAI